MTRSLTAEWAVHGICVNSISPGYMNTVLNEGPAVEAVKGRWLERCAIGRMGEPQELMRAVVMLLSGRAGVYITLAWPGRIDSKPHRTKQVPRNRTERMLGLMEGEVCFEKGRRWMVGSFTPN
jgi:hypothetical protein